MYGTSASFSGGEGMLMDYHPPTSESDLLFAILELSVCAGPGGDSKFVVLCRS